MLRTRLLIFFLALPFMLNACSTARKGDWEITLGLEKRMAQEALPKIRQDYPALRDAEIQNYVSSLGQRIVEANDLDGNPYTYSFLVVDVPTINAFALPAGHVFISSALLELVESEAELAGVLSHEIGHVRERHSATRIATQRWSEHNSYWKYGAAGVFAGGLAGYGVSRLACLGVNSSCVTQLVALGAASGFGASLAIQKYFFLFNSRENELRADRLGFEAATKAGFSAEHAGDFYERLALREKPKSGRTPLDDALETHPPSEKRVQFIRDLRKGYEGNSAAILSSPEFVKMRERVFALKNAASKAFAPTNQTSG